MLSRASKQRTCVCLLTAMGVIALCAGAMYAATTTVFGPRTYTRETGAPRTDTRTFVVSHPSPRYTLHVTNHGVTDADLTLNGAGVLSPVDFDGVPSVIDRTVTLKDGLNAIAVLLRGKPGTSLTVEIFSTVVDTTGPVVTTTVAPAANANGWNNTNVTVSFACSDAESGVASCPAPVTVSTESANQAVTGTATDKAGNSSTATVHVSIDKTAPTITAALATAPNANGWFDSPATVHFTCADSVSGVVSCPPDQTTSGEGTLMLSGSVTDLAGNTATATTGPIRVDLSAPTISAVVTPAPNVNGWNNTPVTVHFVCADTGSGIANCPADQTVSTEGLNQAITGAATDNAGHTASATASVNVDMAPPVLTLFTPDNQSLFVPTLSVVGSVVDAVSGVTNVACNGAPAIVQDGDVSCSMTLAPGSNTLIATATDAAGNTASASLASTYTRVPNITITSPANLSYLNISPTTVSGTVDDPTADVTINSIPAVVAGGTFTLALPLAEGPNIVTVAATSQTGGTSTSSFEVNLDTTPPHVTITSPADQFVTTDASIPVAGNINDIVVGTVNDTQAQVTVNGTAAQVANRMFLSSSVPLTIGPNVIHAIGRDRVGNEATTQITVTRLPAPVSQHISLVSGNNQTGAIGTALAQPLVVALSDAAGTPIPNTTVIFKVTQNDGLITGPGGAPSPTAIVTTGGDGHAQVTWTVGHRAGAGGNGVEAYAVGFDGTAVFTATGTQGQAGKIVVDTGNDQIGAIGQPLPKPFIAVVVDDGNNRLGGVSVTFTVTAGGGTFDGGASTFTVDTDSDGRAATTLTLGLQEGNANNAVEASFASNTGFPAAFTASGRAPGDPQKTIITGVVLDNTNTPIPGVLVRAVATNEMHSNAAAVASAIAAQTDAQGQFDIPASPVGLVKLLVDGSTAQRPGVYPNLEYDIVTIAGQNNTVGQPIYLLPLNPNNQLCVTETTGGGTLTIAEAPGFSLTFGPGQVTFPGGSKDGCVSVTVVHSDKSPMLPGFGQQPRFLVTIQPAGAVFNPPAPMTLPNVDGLRPREVTEMYSFDHDIGSFVAIGTGTVSDDGLLIRTNAGVGVLKAGWHCGGNPSPTGTAADCPQCQKCSGASCVPDAGASCDDGKFCTSADGKAPGPDKCDNGSCKGKEIEPEVQLKAEVDPVKIIQIKKVIEDVSDIATTATKWMPCWIGHVEPDVSLTEEKGKFCCEKDQKIGEGNKLSGGGGLKISAGCFVGLSSIAPELPASLIQAIGIEGKASLGVKLTVGDVKDACAEPQWDEKGDVTFSMTVSAVVVKVGDILGARFEGPKGEAKVGFKGEDLFSHLQWTGSACIDGEVKMVVEHFGVSLEIKLFSLFDKVCWGG